MAYHTAIYESTGLSPFCVLFGQSPTLPVDLLVPLAELSYPWYVSNLKHSLKQAYQNVWQHRYGLSSYTHCEEWAEQEINITMDKPILNCGPAKSIQCEDSAYWRTTESSDTC